MSKTVKKAGKLGHELGLAGADPTGLKLAEMNKDLLKDTLDTKAPSIQEPDVSAAQQSAAEAADRMRRVSRLRRGRASTILTRRTGGSATRSLLGG